MRLPFRDRLRLAWELTWPLSLIDLAAVVLIHGAINAQGEFLDSLWAIVAFFGVSPWVVRRALANPAKGWRVAAVSPVIRPYLTRALPSRGTASPREVQILRGSTQPRPYRAASVRTGLSSNYRYGRITASPGATAPKLSYQQSLKVMW